MMITRDGPYIYVPDENVELYKINGEYVYKVRVADSDGCNECEEIRFE